MEHHVGLDVSLKEVLICEDEMGLSPTRTRLRRHWH